ETDLRPRTLATGNPVLLIEDRFPIPAPSRLFPLHGEETLDEILGARLGSDQDRVVQDLERQVLSLRETEFLANVLRDHDLTLGAPLSSPSSSPCRGPMFSSYC